MSARSYIVPPDASVPKRKATKRASARRTQEPSQANPFKPILERIRNNSGDAPFESEDAVFAWWNKNKSLLRI